MKHIAPLLVLCMLCAPSVSAEENDGLSLMERGAQLFMEGILKEMEPAIDEFSGLAEEMGPALRDFADQMGPRVSELLSEVEDWSVYEAPEVLPNGDIIIRRKPDQPQDTPDLQSEPAPQVDL